MKESHAKILDAVKLVINYLCPRCKIGIDDDGDGDCAFCAKYSDDELKVVIQKIRRTKYYD